MLRWVRPSRTEVFVVVVALVVGIQVLFNIYIARTSGPGLVAAAPDVSTQAFVWLGLSLGPLCAPIASVARGNHVGVLPGIILFTSPCALLLASALARRSASLFLLLDLVWFAFGYLYTIAIWVGLRAERFPSKTASLMTRHLISRPIASRCGSSRPTAGLESESLLEG